MKNKKHKEIENPYNYLANAKEILKQKAKKDGEFYTYPKYVKMAGHTAYTGVLLALDRLMEQQNIQIKHRKDIKDYIEFVRKHDRKILNYLISGYDYLNLCMGYDGDLSARTSNTGLDYAKIIIDWAMNQLNSKK